MPVAVRRFGVDQRGRLPVPRDAGRAAQPRQGAVALDAARRRGDAPPAGRPGGDAALHPGPPGRAAEPGAELHRLGPHRAGGPHAAPAGRHEVGLAVFVDTSTVAVLPTLVWVFALPPETYGPLNRDTLAAIDELTGPRPPKAGVFRTQQTDQTLHRYAALAPLVAVLEGATRRALADLDVHERHFAITGCWANFGEPGSAHMPHHHVNNYLSGVYYLSAPEGGDSITFHDPRPQRDIIEPVYDSENDFNRRQQDVKVATGNVVMFPTWITHSVKPSRAQGLRVSIAFNINFVDFAETIARPRWKGMALRRPPDL
ncbi:MAG: hypothetical protein FJX36_17010 [Alphaproteobacteria bacterium]|nr:hypothetical protein [Alphaproteobacteria bacterium]